MGSWRSLRWSFKDSLFGAMTSRMDAISVTFLGSGDAFGSGGRFQSCILVDAMRHRFLLDCGASSLIAIKKHGVPPSSIGTILVTHLHGDHFGGIPFFVLDAQFSKRDEPLLIAGPPGIRARVREAMEVLFPRSSETRQRFALEFQELSPDTPTLVGSLRVTAYPMVHFCGAPPYAVRVETDGRVIAYSGDTEWTDRLLDAARGADLFVCEAYTFEKPVRFHLDYRALMAHREALECDRLILTHMSPDMLARAGEIDVECAADGMVLMLDERAKRVSRPRC
jgi:ribonuclease BN (tRNA processing enzyme)